MEKSCEENVLKKLVKNQIRVFGSVTLKELSVYCFYSFGLKKKLLDYFFSLDLDLRYKNSFTYNKEFWLLRSQVIHHVICYRS